MTEMSNFDLIKREFIEKNFKLQAINQDILKQNHTRQSLENLNEKGREMIYMLRHDIKTMDSLASILLDPGCTCQIKTFNEMLLKSIQAFRKANIHATLNLDLSDRKDLLLLPNSTNTYNQTSKATPDHESITQKMLLISRNLSETTHKSAATLDTLLTTSVSVDATSDELLHTAGTISQSGRLLKKYGRRECTDKMLLFCAFIFFLASVSYIVHKRLF